MIEWREVSQGVLEFYMTAHHTNLIHMGFSGKNSIVT